MSDLSAPTGPYEYAAIDFFASFQDEARRIFGEAAGDEDLTGQDGGVPIPHYKCVVTFSGQPIELHLSGPYRVSGFLHWNCWPEPPMGPEKAVIGAISPKDAIAALKEALER